MGVSGTPPVVMNFYRLTIGLSTYLTDTALHVSMINDSKLLSFDAALFIMMKAVSQKIQMLKSM